MPLLSGNSQSTLTGGHVRVGSCAVLPEFVLLNILMYKGA